VQRLLVMIATWGEMIKFSHSIFALPFALMAACLAGINLPGGRPRAGQFALIILCMVAARSFAMTFNRIADAHLDARNPRTANRPLPSARISPLQAWAFLLCSAAGFVAGAAGFLVFYHNPWPLWLSIPVLLAMAAYSHAKRFTVLAHFILGTVIAFAPVAAWIAVHPPSLGLPVLLLSAAVCLWIAGFDIMYACQDIEVDRREGLFSLPARLGAAPALVISRLCHFFTVLLLVALGGSAGLGWLYWAGLAVTAVLLVFEQSLVRADDLSRVNVAFFTVNGCVSILLGLTTIGDLLAS